MQPFLEHMYRILKILEENMDCPEFDISQISHDKLGISEERWKKLIEMMRDEGYIKGVSIYTTYMLGRQVETRNIRITLKGLEYLQNYTT